MTPNGCAHTIYIQWQTWVDTMGYTHTHTKSFSYIITDLMYTMQWKFKSFTAHTNTCTPLFPYTFTAPCALSTHTYTHTFLLQLLSDHWVLSWWSTMCIMCFKLFTFKQNALYILPPTLFSYQQRLLKQSTTTLNLTKDQWTTRKNQLLK